MGRTTFWLAPALLLGAAHAAAQPVSYEEALALAIEGQPLIAAREARIEARQEAASAAGELPDPKLSVGLLNLPVTGPDAFSPTAQMMTKFQVGAEQEIPNLAKRRSRSELARAEVDAAIAQLAHAQHLARLGAGQSWVALAFAEQRLGLVRRKLEELDRLIPAANSAVAAGSARPAQSLEIRRALLRMEDARTAIEAEREAAQAGLGRYAPVDDPLAVGGVPSPEVDPALLRATLEHNPELLVAGAAISQAEARADVARADKRPDFGVNVSYGVRDRDYGDQFSVMGSVTLPIFAGRRQDPRIRAAQSEISAVRALREDRLRELAAELEADLAAWRSAYRQWQRARDELLPLARDRAELETASFAAGRAGLIDVIEAKTALALLELEILAREQATVAAATRLRLTYTEHAL